MHVSWEGLEVVSIEVVKGRGDVGSRTVKGFETPIDVAQKTRPWTSW